MEKDATNGMMTKVWGPPGWFFLHSITFGFPIKASDVEPSRIQSYIDFFNSAGDVLPCKYCRESYKEFIKEVPIYNFIDSRESLVKWLYIIHNKVNKKLGIPDCDIPTLEDVKTRYEKYRAMCKQTTTKERNEKLIKGCTIPKIGPKQKCLIKIVEEFGEDSKNIWLYFGILVLVIMVIIGLKIYKK
jgi:hypothetical protein